MALDKQKILNELGSVVNQLQSADCGCMGKLFSNSSGYGENAMSNSQPSYGGCGNGCCHNYGGYSSGHSGGHNCTRGYSSPCAGEPYAAKHMCMGQCNPRKLYGDTYSYLNQNLMEPIVKEVYDDLKSISPVNTVMNNSLGAKMGLMQQGTAQVQGNVGNPRNQMMANGMMQNQIQGSSTGYHMQDTVQGSVMPQYQMQSSAMSYPAQKGFEGRTRTSQNQIPGNAMGNHMNMSMTGRMANQKLQETMGGMGPQIVNMMESSAKKASPNLQGGQLMGSVYNDAQQLAASGHSGVTPMSAPNGANKGLNNINVGIGEYSTPAMSQGKYAGMYLGQKGTEGIARNKPIMDTNQYNINNAEMSMGKSPNQQMNNSNTAGAFYSNTNNSMNVNARQGQGASHQLSSVNQSYGQHTQGMTKFNKMFPGVAGEDLGFDPMAIAIQMNPANHQKAAMDAMKKMIHGDSISTSLDTTANSAHTKTAISGANAAAANINPHHQQNIPQPNQQSLYGEQETITQQRNLNAVPSTLAHTLTHTSPTTNGQVPQPMQDQQQHQTYTQQHQMIDPNMAVIAPILLPLDEGASRDINMQQHMQEYTTEKPSSDIIKDPILPVDITKYRIPPSVKRQKYNDNYNTLGQPVQKVPASFYAAPQESLPQTLSPQAVTKFRNDYSRGLNIKSTESKTALVGYKPLEKTPSKKELQHIYNQYKGSQSFTQQNIHNPPQPSSYSDRKVNIQLPPIEKVGGDTAANPSILNYLPGKGNSPYLERIGDTANKPHGDFVPTQEPPKKQGKCRNGLQDQVYTSYISSAAWSFHGERNLPFTTGYRFRNRA